MPVQIINKNPKPYRDAWNGTVFTFEPNKPVVISEVAAQHIFGYGLDSDGKRAKMVRAGWLIKGDEDSVKAAWAMLYNFVFKEVAPDWKEVLPEKESSKAA